MSTDDNLTFQVLGEFDLFLSTALFFRRTHECIGVGVILKGFLPIFKVERCTVLDIGDGGWKQYDD